MLLLTVVYMQEIMIVMIVITDSMPMESLNATLQSNTARHSKMSGEIRDAVNVMTD